MGMCPERNALGCIQALQLAIKIHKLETKSLHRHIILDVLSRIKYNKPMRIISNKTLKQFYENPLYSDSKSSLQSWYHEALKASWQTPNEIKAQYKNASIIGEGRVVFNIHGNKYRLIVKINYYASIIFIRFVGTHKEYDKINATEI